MAKIISSGDNSLVVVPQSLADNKSVSLGGGSKLVIYPDGSSAEEILSLIHAAKSGSQEDPWPTVVKRKEQPRS